ncbi:MAG: GvpL/GvpF family gas vesicle protein [Leptolyngbyaceae cyanobacterium SM2_5_2]|nr:GvpL/GvpF family gas vesicle protein [Leptolyngbyaceae cyanobacterium SM2_5_2]
MTSRYYLYGIFPTPGPQSLVMPGLDEQPVQAYHLDAFTFLYSMASQKRYLASRSNLLTHEKVLEAAMRQGHRTLLPLQFGLVVTSWEQVEQDLIAPYRDDLGQLFHRLDGCREVSVKVLWDADTELARLMEENPELNHQRNQLVGTQLTLEQVIQIGQRIEAALEKRKQETAEPFRQILSALAKDVIENEPMTDTMIFNAAYLIPWEFEPDFSQAVNEIDQAFGQRLRIRYNNFTAPYHFAQLKP